MPADSANLFLEIKRPYLLKTLDLQWAHEKSLSFRRFRGYNVWTCLSVKGSWVEFKRSVESGTHICVLMLLERWSHWSSSRFLILKVAERDDIERWERVGTITLTPDRFYGRTTWMNSSNNLA